MIRLARPARHHERRVLHSSVEAAPVRVEGGVASIECRTEILARVAERHGFRRVEAVAASVPRGSVSAPALPAPAVEPTPAPAPIETPAPEPAELVSDAPEADGREEAADLVLAGSVDDLISALDAGSLDDLLAVVYVAERAGKNRVTAKRAILSRSRRIGASFDVP